MCEQGGGGGEQRVGAAIGDSATGSQMRLLGIARTSAGRNGVDGVRQDRVQVQRVQTVRSAQGAAVRVLFSGTTKYFLQSELLNRIRYSLRNALAQRRLEGGSGDASEIVQRFHVRVDELVLEGNRVAGRGNVERHVT